ncbi:MAG: hypothetical protein JSU69_03645 [Candidatus Zixiibacteriota bacterium]|nr:MAG: hypothetical protein JSU69_03645 [candidate division Zixibacteria bacterium]
MSSKKPATDNGREAIDDVVSDMLYQVKSPNATGKPSKLESMLKEKMDEKDWHGVIRIYETRPDEFASNSAASIACRQLDDMPSSLYHAVKAFGLAAEEGKDVAKRRNATLVQIANRFHIISDDCHIPLILALEAWKIYKGEPGSRSWCAVTTAAGMLLKLAVKPDSGMTVEDAVARSDSLFQELIDVYGEEGVKSDSDLVNFCRRSIDLTLWREHSALYQDFFAGRRPG